MLEYVYIVLVKDQSYYTLSRSLTGVFLTEEGALESALRHRSEMNSLSTVQIERWKVGVENSSELVQEF